MNDLKIGFEEIAYLHDRAKYYNEALSRSQLIEKTEYLMNLFREVEGFDNLETYIEKNYELEDRLSELEHRYDNMSTAFHGLVRELQKTVSTITRIRDELFDLDNDRACELSNELVSVIDDIEYVRKEKTNEATADT